MQYLTLGPVKIPCTIKKNGEKKIIQIGRLNIPFSTFVREGRKCYRIFFLTLRLPFLDKHFINHTQANYWQKDRLDDDTIKEIAVEIFEEHHGYTPNLDAPRSMSEKIFWLKLHYHDPLVTRCCDKFRVKEYVTETLGEGYVIPTLASWDRAEDMVLSGLPERYVLKVNWSSGYNIIVKDRSSIQEEKVREQVAEWMQPQRNSYYQTFNWGYKDMQPVVYAEEYMEQVEGQLYDYKFFCCNGEVKFWFIATDRFGDGALTHDFFDMDFQKMEFDYGGRAHSDRPLEKPRFYEEMLRCAEKLSAPFPFVRVDFYETGDRFYVGEMTFYPGGGILPFSPVEWDYKLGEYVDVSKLM